MKEALKFDDGKPPIHLLDKELLIETAKVLAFGAKKYEAHNWKVGMNISRYYSACMRHLIAWNDGESEDPETGLSHLAHASCNLMFMLYHTKNNPHLDDRFKGVGGIVDAPTSPDTVPVKIFEDLQFVLGREDD